MYFVRFLNISSFGLSCTYICGLYFVRWLVWLVGVCVGISSVSVKLSTGTILKVGSHMNIIAWCARKTCNHSHFLWLNSSICMYMDQQQHNQKRNITFNFPFWAQQRIILILLLDPVQNWTKLWLDQHFTFSIINLSGQNKTETYYFFCLDSYYPYLWFKDLFSLPSVFDTKVQDI